MTKSADLFAASSALATGASHLGAAADRHRVFRRDFGATVDSLRDAWDSPDSELLQTNGHQLVDGLEPVVASLTRANDTTLQLSRNAQAIGDELLKLEQQMEAALARIQSLQAALAGADPEDPGTAALSAALAEANAEYIRLQRQHDETVRYWRMVHSDACDALRAEAPALRRAQQLSWLMPDLEAPLVPLADNSLVRRTENVLDLLSAAADAYNGPEFIVHYYRAIERRLELRSGHSRTLPNGQRVWVRPHIVRTTRIEPFTVVTRNPAAVRWARIGRVSGPAGAVLTGFLIGHDEYQRVHNDPSLSDAQRTASVTGAVAVEGGITLWGGLAGAKLGASGAAAAGSVVPVVGTFGGMLLGGLVGAAVGSGIANVVGEWAWDLVDGPVVGAVGIVEDVAEDASNWWGRSWRSISNPLGALR